VTAGLLTVACAQLAPRIGEPEHNQALTEDAIRRAAAAGARLLVLPELCTSGYVFADAAEARALAQPLDGPAVSTWRRLTDEHEMVLVAGLCERLPNGAVGNSAVVIDRGELATVYRKIHLWDRETLVFAAGTQPAPVVATSVGPVGVAVCYDAFFPELMRSLALDGAQLITVPMNTPSTGTTIKPLAVEVVTAVAAAATNRVYVVQCDRTGDERGVRWVGASAIIDPEGRLLATADHDGAAGQLLVAEVEPGMAADKRVGDRNDVLSDRRPGLYRM
jgi:predicted amidohydrolase